MRRLAVVGIIVLLVVTGCGIGPAPVSDQGPAPTGLSPGPTLYFVDTHGELKGEVRRTGRLGSIDDAIALLLTGPGPDSALHTEIRSVGTTQVVVTESPRLIQLTTPLTIDDVTDRGIDQLVCTALGVHVQGGGDTSTRVQVSFVQPTAASSKRRRCPVIG